MMKIEKGAWQPCDAPTSCRWKFISVRRSVTRGSQRGASHMSTLVLVHVVISLIGIVAGLVVMFAMLDSNRMAGLTAIFLIFTILTSATGFIIPPFLTDKF